VKKLEAVRGTALADATPFSGYEMHVGETTGPDAMRPFARLADGRPDGAVSRDGRVTGTYVHGLFADDAQRAAWLARLGAKTGGLAYEALVDDILDRFADHLAAHVDCDRLLAISETARAP
jgi:adenosylcobyric acid synthase